MSIAVAQINALILEQLAIREMRVLSLVVAIRKTFATREGFKGDLTASVKSALRKLVASKTVVDAEGMYSLADGASGPSLSHAGGGLKHA